MNTNQDERPSFNRRNPMIRDPGLEKLLDKALGFTISASERINNFNAAYYRVNGLNINNSTGRPSSRFRLKQN
jgi:hypothetical protein